jgi:hypothetical protein
MLRWEINRRNLNKELTELENLVISFDKKIIKDQKDLRCLEKDSTNIQFINNKIHELFKSLSQTNNCKTSKTHKSSRISHKPKT